MERFYLCENCIKPLRIKNKYKSDIVSLNKNVGKCIICGSYGITIEGG